MKKLTLLLVLILSPVQLFSQTKFPLDKGSFMIAGSGGFSSVSGDGSSRVTWLTASPSVAFFVVPNLAVGVNGNLLRFSVSGNSSTFLGMGPSIAYYFGNMNSKSYPFVSSSLFFGRQLDSFSQINLQFSTGVAFMIAKNVAITGQTFLQFENSIHDGPDDNLNRFGIEIGISTFVF